MADKSDVIQDYLNSLNEAMAIHARKAVEGLEFDRTELAEIVDITNRDKGEYQVFNGSTRYFAYSENTSYTLGAKVYVTIQNNDYTQQKLIKGKYKSGDGDTGISWVSPLGNYSAQTDNLIEDEAYKNLNSDTFSNSSTGLENIPVNKDYENGTGDSLLANYNKNLQEFSYEPEPDNFHYASQYKVLYLSKYMDESDDKYNKNFAYMGLSAEFKTGLSAFYPVSGSYGLLILVDYSIKISDEQPREHKLKVCKLDTTSMIGSVYNFNTFYKQEALFKLDNAPKNGMIIHQIAIIFYQDGEFRSNDNKLISPLYNNEPIPDNIFVRKINVQFGDDIKDDPDDKTEIYTLNGLSYDSAQTNDKLSEKRIHLKWEHKNPEKELQDDGTKKWTYKLMERSDLNNVPSAADVKIIANIHWYTDAQYTIDAYRATQAETAAENDNLFRLTEKWKYEPNGLTEEEYQELINSMNLSPKKDYEWLWDEERQMYVPNISASGEKAIDRIITRNAKKDKTASVNDELAGPGWIPINGTFNQIDIEYQPDKERQYSRVWCIIEYGPELLTAENKSTGLVNPDSNYYTVIETNVLEFKNLSWVPDIATHDIATGITLTLDDKTGGHYPIYNATDGRILSRSEVSRLRTLKADMISRYTGNSLLNGNEIILWQIPKTNTMININGTLTNDRSEVLTKKNFNNYRLAEWFKLNNFDFSNYYYLVRTSNTLLAVNPYQGFYINEYYVKSATNNTIFCYIVKNNQIFKGQITLTFAQHGSSGTDYTFSLGLGELVEMPNGVRMGGDNNAVDTSNAEWKVVGPAAPAITVGETNFRRIRFELYDSTNTIINLTNEEKNEIISKWVGRTQSGFYSGYNSSSSTHDGNVNNLQFLVKKEGNLYTDIAIRAPKDSGNRNTNMRKYCYIIMSASVRHTATSTYNDTEYELNKPVNFVQMLPLHFRIDDKYELEGADYITYDDKGTNPQSYSDQYDLINATNEKSFIIRVDNDNVLDKDGNIKPNYKWYPHLDAYNKLVPCQIYVNNLSKHIEIEAWERIDSKTNLIAYIAPILIIQNRYQIPAVNSWNGDLLIDEDNNRVMAATIAAGHKDNQNRFTGIIMGDVGQKNPSSNRVTTTTGLYGYESGAEAFGFKSDGTAFIGKSGTGRIEFNGTSGTIQSANYSVTTKNNSDKEGTLIDLDNGFIDMWGKGSVYKFKEGEWTASSISLDNLKKDYKKAFDNFVKSKYVQHPETYNIKPYYTQPGNWWYGRWNEDYPSTKHLGKYPAINKWYEVGTPIVNSSDTVSLPFWIRLTDPKTNEATMARKRVEELLKEWINKYIDEKVSSSAKKNEEADRDAFMIDIGNLYTKYSTITNYMYGNFSNHITLRADGNPYFKIETSKFEREIKDNHIILKPTEKLIDLIRIDKNNFYLQTADYNTSANTGLKIDLKRGTFDSRGKLTINGAVGSSINFGSDDNNMSLGIYPNGATYLNASGKLNITAGDGSLLRFGNFSLESSGAITATNWNITAAGKATFEDIYITGGSMIGGGISDGTTITLGGYGDGVDGISWNGSNLKISGDIYARSGYFTGTVEAATITGGTITGATISGGSITGTTISAKGYVTCSGLQVGGTEYGMENSYIIYELNSDEETVNTVAQPGCEVDVTGDTIPGYKFEDGQPYTVTPKISVVVKVAEHTFSKVTKVGKKSITFLGTAKEG